MSRRRNAHTSKKGNPRLVRLSRCRPNGEPVYCELHRGEIAIGELVAWWPVKRGTRTMPTAYCETCHRLCERQGQAVQ